MEGRWMDMMASSAAAFNEAAFSHAVQVVGAFSGEQVCALDLLSSTTVLQVKNAVAASEGTSHFCQQICAKSTGNPLDDQTVLANVAPGGEGTESFSLMLMKLSWEYDNAEASGLLLDAAKHGHKAVVEERLRSRTWPGCTDSSGRSALHVASEGGHLEVVQLLMQAGVDLDKPSAHGRTALHMAAQEGNLEVVRLLAGAGADLEKKDRNACTAWQLAYWSGHDEVAKLLAEYGAQTDRRVQEGGNAESYMTALRIAAGLQRVF